MVHGHTPAGLLPVSESLLDVEDASIADVDAEKAEVVPVRDEITRTQGYLQGT